MAPSRASASGRAGGDYVVANSVDADDPSHRASRQRRWQQASARTGDEAHQYVEVSSQLSDKNVRIPPPVSHRKSDNDYYRPDCDASIAGSHLNHETVGAFLVRPASDGHAFSLSVKFSLGVRHISIKPHIIQPSHGAPPTLVYTMNDQNFHTVQQLVDHFRTNPLFSSPPYSIRLDSARGLEPFPDAEVRNSRLQQHLKKKRPSPVVAAQASNYTPQAPSAHAIPSSLQARSHSTQDETQHYAASLERLSLDASSTDAKQFDGPFGAPSNSFAHLMPKSTSHQSATEPSGAQSSQGGFHSAFSAPTAQSAAQPSQIPSAFNTSMPNAFLSRPQGTNAFGATPFQSPFQSSASSFKHATDTKPASPSDQRASPPLPMQQGDDFLGTIVTSEV